jgi:predicted MFS family arabinose efflux permease
MPPTYSLLGDYFDQPRERTQAMAVYWLANPVAALFSFVGGGWLNQRYGWRMTFFLVGIPALLVAVLVKLTIVEPRAQVNRLEIVNQPAPRISKVLIRLWQQQSSRNLSLAIVVLWTMGLGLAPWYAAFMIRSHGMGTSELGIWLGIIVGVSGVIGVLSGGYLASRWLAEDERAQTRLSAVMIACLVPGFALFLLLPIKQYALIALMPVIAIFNFILGPTFSLMQRLVPNEMRATTLAVVMLVANLIGMGVGSQVVGILSDLMMPRLGSDSLRYAILIVSSLAFLASYYFWRVGNTVTEDLAAVSRTITAPA